MTREKELLQALNKLINQTQQALDEGWIYTSAFRKHLKNAQNIAGGKTEIDQTYPSTMQEFHILQQ